MIHAGTGNAAVREEQGFRSDKISWLDKKTGNSSELRFLDQIDEFIGYLNQSCYTGINSYEFHYALYEKGTSYKKHRDQFNNNTNRKYSLVSYLNDDWLTTDGGQLLIYQNELPQAISPNARKAVFFKSDEMEHEVTVASRSRMSITGWLKRI
jgi:SM-20-related protein